MYINIYILKEKKLYVDTVRTLHHSISRTFFDDHGQQDKYLSRKNKCTANKNGLFSPSLGF